MEEIKIINNRIKQIIKECNIPIENMTDEQLKIHAMSLLQAYGEFDSISWNQIDVKKWRK